MKRKQGWSAGKRPVILSSSIRMASPAVCTVYSAIALGRSCALRRSLQTKGIAIMIASCIDGTRYQYSDALFHAESAASTSWQKDERQPRSRVRHTTMTSHVREFPTKMRRVRAALLLFFFYAQTLDLYTPFLPSFSFLYSDSLTAVITIPLLVIHSDQQTTN